MRRANMAVLENPEGFTASEVESEQVFKFFFIPFHCPTLSPFMLFLSVYLLRIFFMCHSYLMQVLRDKDNDTNESLETMLAWTAQQETSYLEEFLPHVRCLASSKEDEEEVKALACGVYQQATADLNRVCSPSSNDMTQNVMMIWLTCCISCSQTRGAHAAPAEVPPGQLPHLCSSPTRLPR
jgi:hypothetical protein